MKIVDEILKKIKIAKLHGENSVIAIFPESLHPWALKELTEVHHLVCEFQGIDNSSVYAEPQYIYDIKISGE